MIKIVVRVGKLFFETYPEWVIVSAIGKVTHKQAIMLGWRFKFYKLLFINGKEDI